MGNRSRTTLFALALTVSFGCTADPRQHPAGNGVQSDGAVRGSGREKGVVDATRDRDQGLLRLRALPTPASLEEGEYHRLLRERCGVAVVMVENFQQPKVQEEMQAYNQVMKAAIEKKFGAGTLAKLGEEAAKRAHGPRGPAPAAPGPAGQAG